MRGSFIKTLVSLAEQTPQIVLLTGDLGYMALEPFSEAFPTRFFNVGVAEQNMVGLATGLAEAGYIPFVYSIVPFAALRPYEFIRNGPIMHQLPVRIVGVGTGFEYGSNGITHYGLEDAGVMRIQPGITVISPADHLQTRTALEETWDRPGPVYYRLGKDDRTTVPGLDGRFRLAGSEIIRHGDDILVISMGSVSIEAAAAAEILADRGVACTVMVVSSFNPAPIDDLIAALGRFRVALTVEAHYVVGGIGSLVSEVVAENGLGCRVVRCGVRAMSEGLTGSQSYMYDVHGLTHEALVTRAIRELRNAHN